MARKDDDWHWSRCGWSANARNGDLTLILRGHVVDLPDSKTEARFDAALAQLDVLMVAAINLIQQRRQNHLNWSPGPDVEHWAPIELRIEETGHLWLSMHEYETDEYSLWLVRFALDDATPQDVRRASYMPDDSTFDSRGTQI